ncbi:MAG: phosphoribosylamine--glycine ligase [Candidatus Pacebacteria bacterium]|nr:phosphoribosylamine--glycine ligase [Candidatus Paceibacterota bacterium]
MNLLLIGSGAREHIIAKSIKKSLSNPQLFCFGSSNNPGIKELCSGYYTDKLDNVDAICEAAKDCKAELAIIGPELPLSAGVVDALEKLGIGCVGPTKDLAQLESSKSFTRSLCTENNIPGVAKFKTFSSLDGVQEYTEELKNEYVVKADGLMGGKGVKVFGEHLQSWEETKEYCEELIEAGSSFVVEEKFVGQEFSLLSFCDGEHLVHMPTVQDHKRAFVGDTGPNTGGMGSYSDANHLLPFLTEHDIAEAKSITEQVAVALKNKFGRGYKGVLYGGFMATRDGVKIIEYNARFGDPEVMNALSVLTSDFVELCQAIVDGTLDQVKVSFASKATVCKYAVPEGYPDNPVKNEKIDVSGVVNKDNLYLAAVDQREDGLYETGSRTVAVVGISDTIAKAERMAEEEIQRIKGPVFHREDVGTSELIQKRVEMMRNLRST